jgi:hypothetical protein
MTDTSIGLPAKRAHQLLPFIKEDPFVNLKRFGDFPKLVSVPVLNQYAFIKQHVEQWIEAHPEEKGWREVARKVAGCFVYISYDEWKKQLKNACVKFLADHANDHYTFVISKDSAAKSEPWVALHALEWLEPKAIISCSQLEEYYKDHPEHYMLFLDDAAYTGSSLETVICDADAPDDKTCVLLPCVTENARDVLQEYGEVYYGQKIYTLEDSYENESIIKRLETDAFIGLDVIDVGSYCLTIFQHKIPDTISSFPEFFEDGCGLLPKIALHKPLVMYADMPPPYKMRGE